MIDNAFNFSLGAVGEAEAQEPARSVLAGARERTGMIPNMYSRMANAPALLQTYNDGYTRFRAEAGFTAAEQEVAFLTISHENGCEYCVAAHSFLGDKASGVPTAVTDAIRGGRPGPDARLGALSTFVRHLVVTRGRPSQTHTTAFLAAGYTEVHILYLVLAIAVKTISNYSNHMFDTPLDQAFASRVYEHAAHAG